MRTKPSLTAEDVKKVIAACEAEAEKNNWNVSIAVADDGGYLLGLVRMDRANAVTAEVAHGKAKCSALTGRPSKFFEELFKERVAFLNFPAGLPIQGGLPILSQGERLGG